MIEWTDAGRATARRHVMTLVVGYDDRGTEREWAGCICGEWTWDANDEEYDLRWWDHILAELAPHVWTKNARLAELLRLRTEALSRTVAALDRVRGLYDRMTEGGYQPYAVDLDDGVHLAVLVDDIRAALACSGGPTIDAAALRGADAGQVERARQPLEFGPVARRDLTHLYFAHPSLESDAACDAAALRAAAAVVEAQAQRGRPHLIALANRLHALAAQLTPPEMTR